MNPHKSFAGRIAGNPTFEHPNPLLYPKPQSLYRSAGARTPYRKEGKQCYKPTEGVPVTVAKIVRA